MPPRLEVYYDMFLPLSGNFSSLNGRLFTPGTNTKVIKSARDIGTTINILILDIEFPCDYKHSTDIINLFYLFEWFKL